VVDLGSGRVLKRIAGLGSTGDGDVASATAGYSGPVRPVCHVVDAWIV
jgi:hypothetical protein